MSNPLDEVEENVRAALRDVLLGWGGRSESSQLSERLLDAASSLQVALECLEIIQKQTVPSDGGAT
jgi:hypothetical protein